MILIVYAHPETDGHCKRILEETKKQLESQKKEYRVIDLYQIKYNPILSKEEHYTSGNYEIGKDTLVLQEEIKRCTGLVFIYPIWWVTMPAILKGFFDRVLTPRFAFKYVRGVPIGLLRDKKAVIFTSSGGPRIYYWFMIRGRQKAAIRKDILKFCGIKSKFYQIYSAKKLNDSKIEKIKRVVSKGLKYLN